MPLMPLMSNVMNARKEDKTLPDQIASYPKPSHSLPSLSIDDRASDLAELKDFLNGMGIQTHNTRIDRYQRYLKLISANNQIFDASAIFKNVTDERFQHEMDWYLYVLREVDELMHIMKGIKAHSPRGVEEKLKKIVSGSDFAALDKNTESRNTQFELRIASYFCQAGFEVDLSTATDIIASKGRNFFYIECKRVSNDKQLEENLLKAKQQLASRMPANRHLIRKNFGLIAMDVTKVAYKHNGLTFGVTNEHAKEVMQDDLKKIYNKIKHINFLSKKPAIIQCWLQIHMPGILENPPQAFTRFSSFFILSPYAQFRFSSAFALLHEATANANLSDPRETPAKKINTSLTLPAGTKLWLDTEKIKPFFDRDHDSQAYSVFLKNDTSIESPVECAAGGIIMHGKNFEFSILDVLQVVTDLSKAERAEFSERLFGSDDDALKSRTELLCMLFLRKHPFYRSEDEHSGEML